MHHFLPPLTLTLRILKSSLKSRAINPNFNSGKKWCICQQLSIFIKETRIIISTEYQLCWQAHYFYGLRRRRQISTTRKKEGTAANKSNNTVIIKIMEVVLASSWYPIVLVLLNGLVILLSTKSKYTPSAGVKHTIVLGGTAFKYRSRSMI